MATRLGRSAWLRSWLYAAGTTWLLAAGLAGSARADLAEVVARVEPSVVVVVASHEAAAEESEAPGDMKHVFGSGFFINETDIATSALVLADAQAVHVLDSHGARHPAVLVGIDLMSRVALLRIAEPLGVPVRFRRTGDIAKGTDIFTLGSHLGMGISVASGMVNGTGRTVTTPGLPSVTDAFQIDAAISGDGAGCPVFGDDGSVVGMALFSLIPDRGTLYRPEEEDGGNIKEELVPGGLPAGLASSAQRARLFAADAWGYRRKPRRRPRLRISAWSPARARWSLPPSRMDRRPSPA